MTKRGTALVAAAAGLIVAAACGLTGNDDRGGADLAALPTPTFEAISESPTPEPTEPTEAAETTQAPTRKPTTAATIEPFWDQLPDCAHKDSSKPVAKGKVKAALKAAAARTYWPIEAPSLKLNYPLVKAVAWMESGWQSNIHNCDGGAGVMQLMPATVDMINTRFTKTYDVSKYQDNAYLGANYLAWLTKWAGHLYFKDSYNLSAARCKSATSWCLLNVVISGYNAGQGTIEQVAASKKLSNPQYVATVRALMTHCKCDQY